MSYTLIEQGNLRQCAELRLSQGPQSASHPAEKMLYELQVHQVELEMVNQQLCDVQLELENSRDHYLDYYDCAPVAYLTLSGDGTIDAINLTGAAMLGAERFKLLKRRFSTFVAEPDVERWQRQFIILKKNAHKLSCELCLQRSDGSCVEVRLERFRIEDSGALLRIVLTDITEQKKAEAARLENEKRVYLQEQQKIAQAALNRVWIDRAEDAFTLKTNALDQNLLNCMLSILVIEDEPGDYGLIKAHLCLSGLSQREGKNSVLWAGSLSAGIKMALDHKPDVVLLDLTLPDSDGLSSVQRMRAALPGIPIVVLTGHDDRALAIAALQVGAQDYLVKGQFDLATLARTVRHAKVRGVLEQHLQLSNEALCRSEALLQQIIRASDDAPWDWKLESVDACYSPRWWAMLGYASNELQNDDHLSNTQHQHAARLESPEQLIGKSDLERWPDELARKYRAEDAEVMFTRRKLNVEERSLDGEKVHWIETCMAPIVDEHDIGVTGFARDITERRLLLEQQAIVQSALDGFLVVSADNYRILDASDVFCAMLGYTVEELLCMHITDLAVIETAAEIAAHFKKICGVGYDRFEVLYRHKQGHQINLDMSVSHPNTEGGNIYAFVRDITERKRTEAILLKTRSQLLAFIQHAPIGIAMFDRDMNYLATSDRWIAEHGKGDIALIGRNHYDLFPDLPAHWRSLHQQGLAGTTLKNDQDLWSHADGSKAWLRWAIQPWVDEAGAIGGIIISVEDITESKLSEQKVLDLSAHIETVREEEKAHLAREIHDELGSTLTAMKMTIYLLHKGLPANTPQLLMHTESLAGLVQNATNFMRQIINDLRPAILDEFGLQAALNSLLEQFHKISGIGVRLDFLLDKDCENGLPVAQSTHLFRILQEALTNVKKHSDASLVVVEVAVDDRNISMTVIDNGLGISENHVAGPNAYGLLGMKERVKQLGGLISFTKPQDGGFGLVVQLPVAPSISAPVNAP
jgi:PAS domain S-box-containing protein